MIVVSNTSPIFYLSTIGQLDLLRQLYNEVVIPITASVGALRFANAPYNLQFYLKTVRYAVANAPYN
ncbi:hypothetical protein [Coleofasciculus sp. E2-BRE-01]|uniref:hypothetical protein n=1 Tax=Coleofasciculus sp. E2-BRE-01 TaxID=3069524 RepID=UPI0032F58F85